jgi:hypothetical protein
MWNIHHERMELLCPLVIRCLLMWIQQTADSDIAGNILWQTWTGFTQFKFCRIQDFRFSNQNFVPIRLVAYLNVFQSAYVYLLPAQWSWGWRCWAYLTAMLVRPSGMHFKCNCSARMNNCIKQPVQISVDTSYPIASIQNESAAAAANHSLQPEAKR